MILFQLAMSPTWGCNYTYLDSEAETMQTKIWRGLDITESQVRKSLDFINNKEAIEQYNSDNFQEIMQNFRSSIQNEHFNSFAKTCQTIYETSDDESLQIAVSIFFQEVTKRYRPYYILQKEMQKTLAKHTNPLNKGCDFHGINLRNTQSEVIQALKDSPQVRFIRLSNCGLSSNNFKRLTMELNLKEFTRLRFIDISGNPLDKTAALALGEWLNLDSRPYVKLTETDLKTSKVENLYDELRKTFTTNQVAEFMKHVIFITRAYLSNTQLKNEEIEVYNRLVETGKIPSNWKEIHLDFYKKYFTKKTSSETQINQISKGDQKLKGSALAVVHK
ncbi:MAG: hypothetical protein ACOH2V_12805 [Candidatus Saccharimonadaceae bacterium]